MSEHDIRALACKLVRTKGPREAGSALGVSRETVLSLAAGARVTQGSFARIREHLRGHP